MLKGVKKNIIPCKKSIDNSSIQNTYRLARYLLKFYNHTE